MTIATAKKVNELFSKVITLACHYATHQHDAEEIAQNAIIKIYNSSERLTVATNNHTYLALTVRSAASDYYRRQSTSLKRCSLGFNSVTGVAEQSDDRIVCLSIAEPEVADDCDEFKTVENALSLLPLEQQEILRLRAAGNSYKQLADIQQISIGTVRSRLHNARRRIRKLVVAGI